MFAAQTCEEELSKEIKVTRSFTFSMNNKAKYRFMQIIFLFIFWWLVVGLDCRCMYALIAYLLMPCQKFSKASISYRIIDRMERKLFFANSFCWWWKGIVGWIEKKKLIFIFMSWHKRSIYVPSKQYEFS